MLNLLAEMSGSSLRDLEQTVHRVVVVLASIPRPSDNLLDTSNPMWAWEQAAMTLMVLREAAQGAYEAFVTGHFDAFHAGQALRDALEEDADSGGATRHATDGTPAVACQERRSSPNLQRRVLGSVCPTQAGQIENVARSTAVNLANTSTPSGVEEPEIEYLAGFIEMTDFDPVAKRGSQFTADAGPGRAKQHPAAQAVNCQAQRARE